MTLTRFTILVGSVLLSILIALPAAAVDDTSDTEADYEGDAVPIEREIPPYPRKRTGRLQAAWVQLSYVISPDGRAIDPIVVDSSGGIEFENEVRKVTKSWRFENPASNAELPYNMVQYRFHIHGRGKGTTRKFARLAQHFMKGLNSNDLEKARRVANTAVKRGGWNLYESTILWLMLGRIAGAEGDNIEQLEMYQRALGTGDNRSLPNKGRIDLLEDIFELQSQFGHFAAAMRTFSALADISGSKEVVERHASRAAEIALTLENEKIIAASATIANPCDCEGGVPLWAYKPARRSFSFANVGDGIKRFEARCEHHRINGMTAPDQVWSLADDWGICQVFVFGEDGATFDFLEHLQENGEVDNPDDTAVASSHVLDRRNRSQ